MELVVPIDLKRDKKVKRKIRELKDPVGLVIIDPKIIELVAQVTVEKGWIGFGTTEKIFQVLLEEYRKMAESWEKFMKEIMKVRIVEGNFRKEIEKVYEELKPDKIYFVKSGGFNPYWTVVKPIYEQMRKIYPIEIL
ncbi:MAG: hypothetical protein DRP25_03290 [Thermotoga sp.]|nr:MAG: hypothetical protein DRP25_03290 [Thermotoga sp.]